MDCLAATYDWRPTPANSTTATVSSSPPCRCSQRSPAEQEEVQQLKAPMELYQHRQRCNQLSQLDKSLVRSVIPVGLRWPRSALKPHHSPRATPAAANNRSRSKKVFTGETFCVSGAFSIGQRAMLSLISDNGGAITTTVNRSCTYLVAESIGSAKTKKAQAQGIPIVTEAWVHTSMAVGKKSTDQSLFLDSNKHQRKETLPQSTKTPSFHTAEHARPSVIVSSRRGAEEVNPTHRSDRNAQPLRSRGVILIGTNPRYDAHRNSEDDADDEDEANTSSDDEDDLRSHHCEPERSS